MAAQERKLRERISSLATHDHAVWYLFAIAFMESVFFPIPPDILLIPLCILVPTKAFRFATMATIGSALGGVTGFMIGAFFNETVGMGIINMYNLQEYYTQIQQLYKEYDLVIIGAAGFSPIPYKVFTITAGMFEINFAGFIVMSILSRGARFFLIAWVLWRGGAELKTWIERNMYPLTMVLAIGAVLGVVLFKLLSN
ncbi:MAG: DedA family protein [Proteobacteria bacterium]|nr:DedA family protein [Pseudomonadota bacterium]